MTVHFGAVLVSFVFYVIAGIVLKANISHGQGVATTKVLLWFTALLIEMIAHYVATRLPGHVHFPGEQIYDRSSTLFTVVLGVGESVLSDIWIRVLTAVKAWIRLLDSSNLLLAKWALGSKVLPRRSV